ncbi:MAG: hypothetical protein P8106_09670 [Gammaproteobacteria bacterium]
MTRLKATVLVASILLAAVLAFNLARPPGQRTGELLPLLDRKGQWPHRHLMQQPPSRRVRLLAEIVRSAGHACEPAGSEFLGLREDLPRPIAFHLLDCDDHTRFVVALVADALGTTHVLSCAKAAAAGYACADDWRRLPLP